ncbi:MAG: hypothetical protein AABZ30_12825 [Myxococcota bacterium]
MFMMMKRPILALLLPAAAAAHLIDNIEHLSGATNVAAVASNGRLAAGISARGELTVLRWPNTTFYEHMNYRTSTAEDARALPYFGAAPNEGSFVGLSVDGGATTWLRDAPWTVEQRYASDDVQTIVTTFRNDAIGATVIGTDVIDPARDALLRRYEVAFDAPPATALLIYFGNFSPTDEKVPFLFGTEQYLDDALRDGAAACDASGATDTAAGGEPVVAIAGDRPADAFQCGGDSVDGVDVVGAPEDAFDDAADGALSGSLDAAVHTTIALAWDLDPTGDLVVVAVAADAAAAGAVGVAVAVLGDGFDAVREAAEAADADWIARAALPATDDDDRLRVAKRALLGIRAGADPSSGAIVASLSSQPPYNFDWPRDGAFFDLALDVAGYPELVEAHKAFFDSVQRKSDGDDHFAGAVPPAGSFAMNFYADGEVGGAIPFEIDEVGLALWGWCEHAKWLADDGAARAYLASRWSAITLAADLLVECRDEETDLQCLANEDDTLVPSVTLHGATTVWLGLASAVRAARFLGRDAEAQEWLARASELRDAIDQHLYVEGEGYTPAGNPYNGVTGAPAWHIFPTRFRAYDDPRMAETAARLADEVRPFFARQTEGGAYHAKVTLALAVYAQEVGDAALLEEVRGWIDVLVKDLATPMGHFGESYVDLDTDGDGVGDTFDNRVAIPHLWEGALVYLSLMAAYGDAGTLVRPELAELSAPDVPDASINPVPMCPDGDSGCAGNGCACAVGRARGWPAASPAAWLFALLAAPLFCCRKIVAWRERVLGLRASPALWRRRRGI